MTEAYKQTKTKDQNTFTLFIQNNELYINNNNNNFLPSLPKFSPGDRKQGINKYWPKPTH